MKKKTTIYTIIVIILTTTTLYIILQTFDNLAKRSKINSDILRINYLIEDIEVDPLTMLVDNYKDTILFSELILSGKKLIINYDQSDCNSCFENLHRSIKKLFKDCGFHNVVLIGCFENYRNFQAFQMKYGGSYEFYYRVYDRTRSNPDYFKPLNNVYLFTSDTDFEQETVFIPSKESKSSEAIEEYLLTIISRFFSYN